MTSWNGVVLVAVGLTASAAWPCSGPPCSALLESVPRNNATIPANAPAIGVQRALFGVNAPDGGTSVLPPTSQPVTLKRVDGGVEVVVEPRLRRRAHEEARSEEHAAREERGGDHEARETKGARARRLVRERCGEGERVLHPRTLRGETVAVRRGSGGRSRPMRERSHVARALANDGVPR